MASRIQGSRDQNPGECAVNIGATTKSNIGITISQIKDPWTNQYCMECQQMVLDITWSQVCISSKDLHYNMYSLYNVSTCLSISPKHPELTPFAKIMEGQSFTIITPWLQINVWESLVISKGDYINDKSKTRSARCSTITLCRPQLLRRQKLYVQNLYCGNFGSLQNHFWFVIYLFCWYDHSSRFSTEKTGINGACFIFVQPRVILITVSSPSPQAKRLLVDASKGQDHWVWWFVHCSETETCIDVSSRTPTRNISLRMIKPGCIERLQGEGHGAPFCFYFDLWSFASCRIMRVSSLICRSTWCDWNSWLTETTVQIWFKFRFGFFFHFKSCLISIAWILDKGLVLGVVPAQASTWLRLRAGTCWVWFLHRSSQIGNVKLDETPQTHFSEVTGKIAWPYNAIRSSEAMCY